MTTTNANAGKTDSERIERAARELAARHAAQRSGPSLDADSAPRDLDQALAIQQRVQALLNAQRGGWKCSLPSPGKIALAPIYQDRITYAASATSCRAPGDHGSAEIEPEIAYLIGVDLPPRATPYSAQEVWQAVASTHLAFELIGARYSERAKEPFANMLADCLANYGLFVGAAIDPACNAGAALENIALTLRDATTELGRWNGKHPDGHPLKTLHWLANHLAANGGGLQRGEVVTTGSYHGVIRVPLETALSMQFGALGKLDVTIHPVA